MPHQHVILVSMPGLRRRDLEYMPRLREIADKGALRDFVPGFPCVTSSVQAAMYTGGAPSEHGIIGNGFYHRDRDAVELWVGRNGLVQGDQIWDTLAARGITSVAWHAQNIKESPATHIITPEPRHLPDGRIELWCYSKPEGLYEKLLRDLGHFPLMNYWGPMNSMKSTEWIVNAALWLLQRERPRFNFIYFPHLDYAAQKFGPDSEQQIAACREADEQIGRLIDGVAGIGVTDVAFIFVGEYAITEVSRVMYPNRMLRDAGLLRVDRRPDGEHLLTAESLAFAVVDHQFAHVYVQDHTDIDAVSGIFEGLDGIAQVLVGPERGPLNHPRSGEVVLVCEPDTWLAYYWWLDDDFAPAFARTVDIHAKPGYDPVEMFIDLPTKQTPLDATLIKGSHGAPAESPDQLPAIIASLPDLLPASDSIPDFEIRAIVERALVTQSTY
ncbi:MAG TPA: alkaline phosphatase family protein [Phycisphaerae bacterium]|nr:alkaline phosphatase family protein [Phycisphaerae bacterium]